MERFWCAGLQTVLGIILGGGAGSRLYPLTKKRAKPAVPLGANYRLIDITVSNCINSNVNKVYCLTQFNSASLNRHLSQAYNANVGGYSSRGFVEVGCHLTSAAYPNTLWVGRLSGKYVLTIAPAVSQTGCLMVSVEISIPAICSCVYKNLACRAHDDTSAASAGLGGKPKPSAEEMVSGNSRRSAAIPLAFRELHEGRH